jgi:hypothetical protein
LKYNNGVLFSGLAGLFLGLSVFAHPTSLIFIPAVLLYSYLEMRKGNKRSFIFSVFVLAMVLISMGVINYLRYDSFTEFGYGSFSGIDKHDGWRGLIGLLISPGAGLLIYFPISILLPLSVIKIKNKKERRLMYLFFFMIFINWLYIGTLSFDFEPFSWWGFGWGPRYMIPMIPLITILIGKLLIDLKGKTLLKSLIFVLSILGFSINFLGLLVWINYDQLFLSLQKGISGDEVWNTLIWNPVYSPIVVHAEILMENYVAHIPVSDYLNTSWHWVSYGLAPCPVDNYVYCNYGIIPIVFMFLLISTIAMYVLSRIKFIKPKNQSLKHHEL